MNDRDKIIDEILAYLSLSDMKPYNKWKWHNVRLQDFKAIEPIMAMGEEKFSLDVGYYYSVDENIKALDDPLDISILRSACTDETKEYYDPNIKFVAMRFRSVSPKEVRGIAKRITPFIVEMSQAQINHDATYETSRILLGSFNGSDWIDIVNRQGEQPLKIIYEKQNISIAICQQFLWPAHWRAIVETQIGCSMGFMTDPSGAREIFRWRDIPEGKERRAAIRHWVTDHWRQKKNSPEDLAWVRKHLRGKQEFVWNGYKVTLIPPKTEVEAALNQEKPKLITSI